MIAYAVWAFPLDRPDDKGVSRRKHLESVERQTGKRPRALDGPEPPDALAYLLDWFRELSLGRQPGNGFGPARLTWADLAAWAALLCTGPEPWELRAILSLDNVWLDAMTGKP